MISNYGSSVGGSWTLTAAVEGARIVSEDGRLVIDVAHHHRQSYRRR